MSVEAEAHNDHHGPDAIFEEWRPPNEIDQAPDAPTQAGDLYVRRADVERVGYTQGCRKCDALHLTAMSADDALLRPRGHMTRVYDWHPPCQGGQESKTSMCSRQLRQGRGQTSTRSSS